MYCQKCGAEIIGENKKFCAHCGNPLGAPEKKKKKMAPWKFGVIGACAALLIALIIVGAIHIRSRIIRDTIREAATKVMDTVKAGPTEEQTEQVAQYLTNRLINSSNGGSDIVSKGVVSLIEKGLSQDYVVDIYQAMVRCMDYEIQDVKAVDSNHYTVSIYVENVNTKKVITEIINDKRAAYDDLSLWDKILQGLSDAWGIAKYLFGDDLGEAVTALLDLYETKADVLCGQDSFMVTGTYTLDFILVDGEWKLDADGGILETGTDLLLNCWGFE